MGVQTVFLPELNNVNKQNIQSYLWRFGTGDSMLVTPTAHPDGAVSYTYSIPGFYALQLRVNFTNRPPLDTQFQIVVNNPPISQFEITSQDSQCFNSHVFTIQNLSTAGSFPANPVSKIVLDWGDTVPVILEGGNLSLFILSKKFTQYKSSYSIKLAAFDSIGCTSNLSKSVFLKPAYPVGLTISGSARCDSTDYIFIPTAAIPKQELNYFRWDFGDGTYYGSKVPPDNQDSLFLKSFTKRYYANGLFYPKLSVNYSQLGCTDSAMIGPGASNVPENIHVNVELKLKLPRSWDNPDSVCLGKGLDYIYMYNKYPIKGSKNQVYLVWNMNNGNGPFSYSYGVDTVWLNYNNKLGHYFPSLEVNCPNSPVKIYSYYSRIDTVTTLRAGWPSPTSSVSLNSVIGKRFSSSDSISLPNPFPVRYGNLLNIGIKPNSMLLLNNHNLLGKPIRFVSAGGISSGIVLNQVYLANYVNDSMFQLLNESSKQVVSFTTTSAAQAQIQQVFRNYDSFASNWDFLKSFSGSGQSKIPVSGLRGYGIQILGPASKVESPEVGIKINPLQANQCSNGLPVEFTNTSAAYLSNDVFNLWDFDDEFAPACTSFSVPKASFGFPPYTNANDLKNRTNPMFWSGGKMYSGSVNCRFSFDSLPIHKYENWTSVYNWYVNGHDFPPYDTSKWTTNPALVTWPGNPAGKRLVHPLDSASWNKPIFSLGASPIRIDTMNIWPEDINPGKSILLTRSLPDPFAHAKGLFKFQIPAGTTIPLQGAITPATLGTFPDGQNRNYSGSQSIQGGKSLYRYAFDRGVQHCFNVKLKQKDSVNHAAGKGSLQTTRFNLVGNTLVIPEYQNGILIRSNSYTLGVQIKNNKFYFKGPDSLSIQQDSAGSYALVPIDYRFLDSEDCESETMHQLPLMKPDAFGATPVGLACYYNYQYGSSGINFNGGTFNSGLGPVCGKRSFLYINYDSLADRNDNTLVWNGKNTRCMLDAFFDFNGINPLTGTNTSPGGYLGVPFYSGQNYNPNTLWQNPNGSIHYFNYFHPETPNWVTNSSLKPADKDGFVTIGIIVGNGYTNSTLNTAECFSDTIWYHNFFHFISLNPEHYIDNADTVENYLLANPTFGVELVKNPNYLNQFNFLFPAKFQPGKPERSIVTFRPKQRIQKYVGSQIISYSDPYRRDFYIRVVDSIFSNAYDTLVLVPIQGSPNQSEWRLFPKSSYPYLKKRYWFTINRYSGNLQVDSIQFMLPGSRFVDLVKLDTSWRCEDPFHVLAPLSIAKTYYRFDSSFYEEPLKIRIQESRSQLNESPHENISTSLQSSSGCSFSWYTPYICGAMDTFSVRNFANEESAVFCEGETIRLRDSVFYFFPNEDKSEYTNILFFTSPFSTILDTTNYFRRPYLTNITDSIRVRPNFIKYFVLPGNQTCPSGYTGVPFSISSKLGTKCMKQDTFFMERILWDINGDGAIDRVGPNPVINGLNPGKYTIRLITRDSMGNWDTCSRLITVNSRAKIGVLPDTIFSSSPDSVFLNVPSGYLSYLWSNGSTIKSTWIKAVGKYTLTVKDSSGCTKSDSVYVNFFRKAMPTDTLICSGGSLTIRSNTFPSQKIQWWNGDTSINVLVKPDSTRYYSFQISIAGITKWDSVLVRVRQKPVLQMADTFVFPKYDFPVFKGEKGFFYSLNNQPKSDSFPLATTGLSVLRKTDSIGCFSADTFTVIRRISLATKDTSICKDDLLTLKMDTIGMGTFTWFNDSTKSSFLTTFSQSTLISATINLGSFKFKDSAFIQLNPKPVINLADTFWMLDSDSIRINAGPSGNIYRLNGQLRDSIFWIKSPGNYVLSSRNSALCETSKTFQVIQVKTIPLSFYSICRNSELQISILNPGSSSRIWSINQDTSATLKIAPDSSFWLYCTFRNGSFVFTDSTRIQVNSLPEIPVPDSLFCFDSDSSKYIFPANLNYQWSTGKVGNQLVVSNTSLVNLIVQDSNSCVSSKQVQLIKLPGLIAGPVGSACFGDTFFVQLPNGSFKVYHQNQEVQSQFFPVKIVGDSLLKFDFVVGSFSFPDSIQITSRPLPSGTFVKWPTKACEGDTVFIQVVQPNLSYQWYRNDTLLIGQASGLLKTKLAGLYSCHVQDSNLCGIRTLPESVVFNPLPSTRIISKDTLRIACENTQQFSFLSKTDSLVPLKNQQWILNGIFQSDSTAFVPGKLNNGMYTLRLVAQSDSGCLDADSTNFQILKSPEISGIAGDSSPVANSASLYKIDSIPGASYQWFVRGGTIVSGQGTSAVEVIWLAAAIDTIGVTVKLGDCSEFALRVISGLSNSILQSTGNSDFVLAPNPAAEAVSLFHVHGEFFQGSVEIRDQQGRLVKSFAIPYPVNVFRMPVENLASAIYHVRFINNSNRTKTFLFIKRN